MVVPLRKFVYHSLYVAVVTSVVIKNSAFWYIMSCIPSKFQEHFEGIYIISLHVRRIGEEEIQRETGSKHWSPHVKEFSSCCSTFRSTAGPYACSLTCNVDLNYMQYEVRQSV